MDTLHCRRGFSGVGLILLLLAIAIGLFLYFGSTGTNKSYMQNVAETKKRGETVSYEMQARQLATLVADYRMNHNDKLPSGYEELGVDQGMFLDQWRNPMRFTVETGRPATVVLISAGPDEQHDTADDITTRAPLPF